MEDVCEKILKKRGRKPKPKVLVEENITIEFDSKLNENVETIKVKKRGRKPKGGKIIQQSTDNNEHLQVKPNVVLHLKCSLKDLISANCLESNIESFNFIGDKSLTYQTVNTQQLDSIHHKNDESHTSCDNSLDEDVDKKQNNKNLYAKLKQLQHSLHINNCNDKKSACFWCTYDFDNPPIFIPKHFIKESYHVYGCFCSPECGAAYLMNENIDSSAKFERFYLLNYIYSKIYNYKKSIKPAPNPYHTLDKFYGNLNIQEYRSLFKNERLFLIVEKPLTRILPELHEDNDDFIINNKIIPSNNYQFKKSVKSKINKNNIVNEKFGIF